MRCYLFNDKHPVIKCVGGGGCQVHSSSTTCSKESKCGHIYIYTYIHIYIDTHMVKTIIGHSWGLSPPGVKNMGDVEHKWQDQKVQQCKDKG